MQQCHTLQQTHTIETSPLPPRLLFIPTIHPSLLLILSNPPSYSSFSTSYSSLPRTPHTTPSIPPSLLQLIQHLLFISPFYFSSKAYYPPLLPTRLNQTRRKNKPNLLLLLSPHLNQCDEPCEV